MLCERGADPMREHLKTSNGETFVSTAMREAVYRKADGEYLWLPLRLCCVCSCRVC